ncbi:MAG: ketoacyl-ACP synthase III [Clostridia bacterium]|nr:ketoacyl-ACP synthase III [Clostridia bacterium]
MSLKILSVKKSVPQKIISNEDLAKFLDTNDQWISSRTGIKNRHICASESLVDLCEDAVKKAVEQAGIAFSDIDLVICSTLCGDYLMPSLACCVCERIKISCPAFDINAACSGFIYALDIADGYISTGKANNILIISAEMMSKLVDWTDRTTCVLFGDGAAACIVTKGNAIRYLKLTAKGDTNLLSFPVGTGNSPYKETRSNGFVNMQGQEVFKFAVFMIESQSKLAFEKLNITADDIDYFVLHQANKRIIESARTRLKQPEEKFPINIQNYGNISSVTIPLLLDEMLEDGRIKKGTRLFLSAFGAGLTTGTCVMIWE